MGAILELSKDVYIEEHGFGTFIIKYYSRDISEEIPIDEAKAIELKNFLDTFLMRFNRESRQKVLS